MFYNSSSSSFLSTRNLQGPGPISAKFCDMSHGLPPPPKKTCGARNILNLAWFRTTSHFEGEYLWIGQRYPKSENYLTHSVSSGVGRKKFGWLKIANKIHVKKKETQLRKRCPLCWPTLYIAAVRDVILKRLSSP